MEKSVDPKTNISTKMKATLKFGVCYVQILGPWENSKQCFLRQKFLLLAYFLHFINVSTRDYIQGFVNHKFHTTRL